MQRQKKWKVVLYTIGIVSLSAAQSTYIPVIVDDITVLCPYGGGDSSNGNGNAGGASQGGASQGHYIRHRDVTATLFWVGEPSGDANAHIPNDVSAWDDAWLRHYGGIDDPDHRDGYFPKDFIPKENPFYFALPFNDFTSDGLKKAGLSDLVPWATDQDDPHRSILKNRWIKIIAKNGKVAYAQWEDVGPMNEDDRDYVFGRSQPENTVNQHAGLDLSPAVTDYLGLNGMEKVDWEFVDDADVPDGPWRRIVTTRNVYWHNETEVYGSFGTHGVASYAEQDTGDSIVFYPSDISQAHKTPLVFFCPGWNSHDPEDYHTLLHFIASRGYSVIYAKDYYGNGVETLIERFEKILDANNDVLPYVDTSRIGVIGHSLGGGHVFRVLEHFASKGYGSNGRFMMALDPWFAFGMTSDRMRSLPSDTYAVIQRYDNSDRTLNDTDARIVLSEFALLSSIEEARKDYQIVTPATHGYPTGNRSVASMKRLLTPLGALMELTFHNDQSAYAAALNVGSDHPQNDGEVVRPVWSYPYRCDSHANRSEIMDIDYCHQFAGGKVYPSDTTLDQRAEADVAKPSYLGRYVDPVFGNTVTRITDRSVQHANAKPDSKTQVWNADMRWICLGSRIYDADHFSESTYTQQAPIRATIRDIKWSSYQPNVMYGIDDRSDRYVFVKIELQDDGTLRYTDMPQAVFLKSDYDIVTLTQGNLDFQDNYVVFAGRKKDTNRVTLIVYYLQDNYGNHFNRIDTIQDTAMRWFVEDANGHFTVDESASNRMFAWVSISPLGRYVLVKYRSKPGDGEQHAFTIEEYDRSLHHVRRLVEDGEDGDMGLSVEGEEVYVQFGYGTLNGADNRGVWLYRLDGTPRVRLLPDHWDGGTVSCRNYQRPGWCYLDRSYQTNGGEAGEVFALKTDGSGTVERFAQTHHSSSYADRVEINVSPDGTKVLFDSDWHDANTPADSYLVKVGE